MSIELEKNQEIYDFYELVVTVIKKITDIWVEKEGDCLIEIRDDKGRTKAKITGAPVIRIGKTP